MKRAKTLSLLICALVAPSLGADSLGSNLALSWSPCRTVNLFNVRVSLTKRSIESPQARGFQVLDINVLNNRMLFAVARGNDNRQAEYAAVLGTSDGGKSWHTLLSHPDMWFYSVRFVTSTTGWVAGYDGLVMKTTDGGMSWTKQHTGVHSALIRIQMIDQKTGWVMGRDGELLHTSDGGRNWRSHKLKGHGWVESNNSRKEFAGWLNSLFFSDHVNGWIVGGEAKVYHSTDGGVSWQPVPSVAVNIPGWQNSRVTFHTVKFLSAKVGFIAGTVTPKVEREVPPKGVLLRTEDGGVTWGFLVVTPEDSLADIELLTDREMWSIPGFGDRLLHTGNGGKTWSAVKPDEGMAMHVKFADLRTGWLIVSYGMFMDEILYTVDGGNTWARGVLPTG